MRGGGVRDNRGPRRRPSIDTPCRYFNNTMMLANRDEKTLRMQLTDVPDMLLSDVLAQHVEELQHTSIALEREADALRAKNLELAAALEAACQASEIKSRFLASISHEFRTPLNGIIGFSELLYDAVVGPVTSDQQDCLSDILSCSRHLLTLINQVLDLTKIECGRMDFQYEDVHVETIAREVLDGVKAIAAGKGIVIRLEPDDRLGVVRADAARLRQVLFNYLSNALKFTPRGGYAVVRICDESSETYRIQVDDTGPGMRSEDLPLLFIEFSQIGAAGNAKSGTGLGLAITRRIVEAQGGSVGVASTVGKGSSFWAVLPKRPAIVAAPIL